MILVRIESDMIVGDLERLKSEFYRGKQSIFMEAIFVE